MIYFVDYVSTISFGIGVGLFYLTCSRFYFLVTVKIKLRAKKFSGSDSRIFKKLPIQVVC